LGKHTFSLFLCRHICSLIFLAPQSCISWGLLVTNSQRPVVLSRHHQLPPS
jgi:hypothetical protein